MRTVGRTFEKKGAKVQAKEPEKAKEPKEKTDKQAPAKEPEKEAAE